MPSKKVIRILLALVAILFVTQSLVGITWGLPTRAIDRFLFGDGPVWTGEKILALARAEDKFSKNQGADVDADPLQHSRDQGVSLTDSDEDIAKIYLRYRLYTYQPDEMITMMALRSMSPGKLDFDPRLYQYGGLFIYPVGAAIQLAGWLGFIDVRSDVVYYLDHPEEFGKFYVVARAYSAAWGLLGVFVVFALARKIAGAWPAILASFLFAVLPVVVCMAHEGKPHLPGAVLMLLAVLFAMRHAQRDPANPQSDERTIGDEATSRSNDFWFMCISCGAALGMVLSSWPIFIVIPLTAWLTRPSMASFLRSTIAGSMFAVGVYLATNPYILINALTNRDVLRSNFGNSLAMYQISRLGEGFIRVIELTTEGATLPVLLLGTVSALFAFRNRVALILFIPAVVFFLQFVFIGAGKPAEYGRFGIFTNTALCIGASCLIAHPRLRVPLLARCTLGGILLVCVGAFGFRYVANFHADSSGQGTRMRIAQAIGESIADTSPRMSISVRAEPAPYSLPPLDFQHVNVLLAPHAMNPVNVEQSEDGARFHIRSVDRTRDEDVDTPIELSPSRQTPISWANKPFVVSVENVRPAKAAGASKSQHD